MAAAVGMGRERSEALMGRCWDKVDILGGVSGRLLSPPFTTSDNPGRIFKIHNRLPAQSVRNGKCRADAAASGGSAVNSGWPAHCGNGASLLSISDGAFEPLATATTAGEAGGRLMWQALLFDVIALPFAIGTAWYSIAKGKLVYRGTQHITRAGHPLQFWLWIGFIGLWCVFALLLTAPAITAGLQTT